MKILHSGWKLNKQRNNNIQNTLHSSTTPPAGLPSGGNSYTPPDKQQKQKQTTKQTPSVDENLVQRLATKQTKNKIDTQHSYTTPPAGSPSGGNSYTPLDKQQNKNKQYNKHHPVIHNQSCGVW